MTLAPSLPPFTRDTTGQARASRIVAALDPLQPKRLRDIAQAVDHHPGLMSGSMDDLLRQGRVRRVGRGLYVRNAGTTEGPSHVA